MFEQLRYDFILEAVTPIAHASESIGNTSLVMRKKHRLPDGSFVNIPIVTGDTMRNGLRRAASLAVLDAAGMLDDPSLSEAALRLLFNGGMISGSDGGSVKLDAYRELVELCPPLGILGGCAQNRAVPGKLHVDNAVLICEETAAAMPEWVMEWLREKGAALHSARGHIEEVQRVRMDVALDPSMRKLLSDGGAGIENRLLSSEHGKEVGDAVLAESSKSTMLPRRFETVVSGSIFYWSLLCTVQSELERDTFNTMVGAFLRDARVGGKRATGHGQIRPVVAKQIAVLRPRVAPENLDPGALAPKVGSLFYSHVQQRADRVKAFFAGVDA